MRQAKRTVASQPAITAPHSTVGAGFWEVRADGPHLFSVNAGIAVHEAMQHASNLLDIVNNLVRDVAVEERGGGDVTDKAWAAVYLGSMAKAIIDSATIPPATQTS